MSNFYMDSKSIRKLIKDALYEKYKSGFSIVKELIQNANDAGATVLHLGWSRGEIGGKHPLLNGVPAVFVVNNGNFTFNDSLAIGKIWSNFKDSDATKIGKFGLGLKSVFHLCDAFFYLASDVTEDPKLSRKRFDILNPWDDENPEKDFHPDWKTVIDSDSAKIKNFLDENGLLNGMDQQWFCIWIPLRCKSISGEHCLLNSFPGDKDGPPVEEFFEDHLEISISKIMPLLNPIKEVACWEENEDDISQKFRVVRNSTTLRSGRDLQNNNKKHIIFSGKTIQSQLSYSGIDWLCKDKELQGYYDSDHWPRNDDSLREPAFQHCAVCFMQYPVNHQPSCLTINWAVFLPLTEIREEIQLEGISGKWFNLTLHGWYFIDSGRQRIDFQTDNANDPTKNILLSWNTQLAKAHNLPLIIPTLEKFVQRDKISENEISSLVYGIQQSNLYKEWKNDICKKHLWISKIVINGNQLKSKWVKTNSDECIYYLPKAVKKIQDNVDVGIDELAFLVQNYCCTWEKDVSLSPKGFKPIEEWPDEMVHKFNTFLLKLFRDFSWNLLGQHGEDVFEIIRNIPKTNRICFNLPNDAPEFLHKSIFSLTLSQLYIPKRFDPLSESSEGKLHVQDALSILEYAYSKYRETNDLRYSKIALWVVKNLHDHARDEVLRRTHHIKIFKVKNYKEENNNLFSWNELKNPHGMLIFKGIPTLLKPLQKALPYHTIILIDNDVSDALLWREASMCDEKTCLNIIGEHPPLSDDPLQRVDLISRLQIFTIDSDCRRALRYLIHGSQEHFHGLHILYVDEHNDLWSKLLKAILESKEEEWRIIERTIVATLYQYWSELNIKQIGINTVLNELKDLSDPEIIDFSSFTSDEREDLIHNINNHQLLKNLRIFEDMEGNMTCIYENTYLHTDFDLPNGLNTPIHLIKNTSTLQNSGLVPPLDAQNAIAIILTENDPSIYWTYIMETIGTIETISDPDVIDLLKEKSWIPLQNGGMISPQNVLYTPHFKDNIIQDITNLSQNYYCVKDLHEEFSRHSAFQKLLRIDIFPKVHAILECLGEILSQSNEGDKYYIGNLSQTNLNDFVKIFDGVSDEVMPAYLYIKYFQKEIPNDGYFSFVKPLLNDTIKEERIVKVLNYLADKHEKEQGNIKKKTLEFFSLYLKIAVETDEFYGVLQKIRLLNRNGTWKSANKLTMYSSNINFDFIVNEKLEKIIFNKVQDFSSQHKIERGTEERKNEFTRKEFSEFVRKYFNTWGNLVSTDLIGAFVCLLGNNQHFKDVAEDFFRNSSIQQVQEDLKDIFYKHGKNLNSEIKKECVLVKNKIKDGDSVSIPNLFGNSIQALLADRKDIKTIFVGNFEEIEKNTFKITVRELHINTIDAESLKEILCESISELCSKVYGVTIEDEAFFKKLAETDQMDIWVAKRLIVENAVLLLQQLGISFQPGEIKERIKEWNKLRYSSAQARINGSDEEKEKIEKDKDKLLTKIESLLKDNVDTRNILLESVRKKIHAYQYTKDSVLFELFQNADDAVAELIEKIGIQPERNEFEVNFPSGNRMTVMHWGREINRNRGKKLSSEEGRELGYDRDLEKMLVLNVSDKSEQDNFVTGKFGLGFKSVFLITDKPKVLSGRLNFWVAGGIYPRFLEGNSPAKLKNLLGNTRSGTVFDISLDHATKEDVLQRFQFLSHILVIFSRRIKKITIDNRSTVWPGEEKFRQISLGSLPQLIGEEERIEKKEYALLIDTGEGQLLYLMNSSGFKHFNQDHNHPIPTIWVTNPTREEANLGFLINADFDLDIGRSRLPTNSPNNKRKAQNIGIKLKGILQDFHKESEEDWNTFQEKLKLNSNIDKYDFWNSLFEVSINNLKKTGYENDNAMRLATEIIVNDNNGYIGFLKHANALPNGLWSGYRCLTTLDDIRFKLKGVIDQEEIFIKISKWPFFQKKVRKNQVISGSIIRKLPTNNFTISEITELDLNQIVLWETEQNNNFLPEKAGNFGRVFSKEFMLKMEHGNDSEKKEYNRLKSLFDNFKFKTRNNGWQKASYLIISSKLFSEDQDRKDELLRADFAPDRLILHADYHQKDSLTFIMLCRQRLRAPAKDMAEWAAEAQDEKKQTAVFEYILKGDLRLEFGNELSGIIKTKQSWLSDIYMNTGRSSFLSKFSEDEKREILRILNIGIQYKNDFEDYSIPDSPYLDPSELLNKIYKWWQEKQNVYLQQYENDVYPLPSAELAKNLKKNSDKLETRKNWMTIFLLGIFHTFGLKQYSQDKSFIQKCQGKGWLDIFSQADSTSDQWIGILEDYIKEQDYSENYQYWMRMFPNIYKISKHLEEYRQLFLNLEKYDDDFSLETLLTPYEDINAVANAPSVKRTFGVGGNFIIRELVRLRVIKGNQFIYKHCFVPSGKVRNFFISLGCQNLNPNSWENGDALVIYNFVKDYIGEEQVTFNHCFDIAITQYKKSGNY